jgi:hypothetical protein
LIMHIYAQHCIIIQHLPRVSSLDGKYFHKISHDLLLRWRAARKQNIAGKLGARAIQSLALRRLR